MAKKKKLSFEEKLEQALVPEGEQPYEVPENWCWVRLQYVSSYIKAGGDKPKRFSKEKNSEMSVPVVANGIENDGIIGYTDEFFNNAGSVTVAGRGTIGYAIYRNYVFFPIVRLLVIMPKKCVIPQYIKYLFDYFEEKGTGSSIPQLTVPMIKDKKIPCPPLAEQQRIVDRIESLFSKLDEAKKIVEEIVDEFENRKAAILHKAFSGELTKQWRDKFHVSKTEWKNTSIGEISQVKGGKRVPKGMSLTAEDTGHPYIRAGNLKQGTVIDDGMMYVPDDVLPYIKNYTVSKGDVYITNVGACIGDCGTIPEKYDGVNLTENAVKITELKCDSMFLALYLSSNIVQQGIKSLIASATLGKLSIANIKPKSRVIYTQNIMKS